MERELSGTLGLDVSTPPGANELGQQLGHSNLYVKNLPANVDEPALWQLFSRCGTIEAGKVVIHCMLSAAESFIALIACWQSLLTGQTPYDRHPQSHALQNREFPQSHLHAKAACRVPDFFKHYLESGDCDVYERMPVDHT